MIDFLISVSILYMGVFISALIGCFVIFGIKRPIGNIKQAIFLLRWFIIDKYHCSLDQRQKKYLSFLNKLFWGGVIIGWALLLAFAIENYFKG